MTYIVNVRISAEDSKQEDAWLQPNDLDRETTLTAVE